MTFDQTLIIGVGKDKYIETWDARDGKPIKKINIGGLSKMNYLTLSHSIFSENYYSLSDNQNPNRSQMGSNSWDIHKMTIAHQSGEASIWDLRKMDKVYDVIELHQEDCRSVEYDPSCRYLASASFDCNIKIYDLEKEETCHIFSKFKAVLTLF